MRLFLLPLCLLPPLFLAAVPAAGQEKLTDAELEAQTGGLRTPDGMEFTFGAVVDTYVDGAPVLQTQINFTDQGIVQTHSTGAPQVTVPGLNGETVVIHDLDTGYIANLVLNSADNRDITQATAFTVGLSDQLRADLSSQQSLLRLQDHVNRALTEGVR